jgi:WD40 repeat protein
MSLKKTRGRAKPSLGDALLGTDRVASSQISCFHPSRTLFAVVGRVIGENVVRVYDTDRGVSRGGLDARSEVRLGKGERVSCLAFLGGQEGKKRKRVSQGDLIVGLTNGKLLVLDQGIGEVVRTLSAHTAEVSGWCVHEDKGWSCALDGQVKCWDYKSGSCLLYTPPEMF